MPQDIQTIDEEVAGDLENVNNFFEEHGTEQGAWRGDVSDWGSPATLLRDRDS
jgi:hypothetical protein